MRALISLLPAIALLIGCSDDPPPPACQMEVLAHLAPLPASMDPFDYQYSEVAAKDGIAYLGASHGAGVLVLDTTTGQTLAVLDPGLGRTINSVAVSGNLLAFAPGSAGVVVYDISNPRAPARRAQLTEPVSYCHTVFIHDQMVYCATSSQEPQVAFLRVTTPADPTAPLELAAAGSYDAPPTPEEEEKRLSVLVHDLFVHEKGGRRLAYLAFWERGLQVVDVTDPAHPALVGASPPTPSRWTHSVWVDGDYAYVGEESYKGVVRVFDVADTAAPREVGLLRSSEGDAISAHNVHVADGFVYASWYQDGLRVFPARGAADTREVAYFHTWNGADNRGNPALFDAMYAGNWDVFVEGSRIYASDMQTGLWVLRHRPGGEVCADRPRGTSAFAKSGRPPIGWGWYQPRRLRPQREISFLATVDSVDPYFNLSPAMVEGLNPRLSLLGARSGIPAHVLAEPSDGPARIVRGTAWVSEYVRPGDLWIVGEMEDEGARRLLREPIEVLPVAPPNEDVEPNDDVYVSAVVRHDIGAAPVSFSGSVGPQDRRDIYLFELYGPPPSLGLITAAVDGEPEEPAAVLTVRTISSEEGFGPPAIQPVAGATPRLRQTIDVPEGTSERLYVIVTSAGIPGKGGPVPYQLEIARP